MLCVCASFSKEFMLNARTECECLNNRHVQHNGLAAIGTAAWADKHNEANWWSYRWVNIWRESRSKRKNVTEFKECCFINGAFHVFGIPLGNVFFFDYSYSRFTDFNCIYGVYVVSCQIHSRTKCNRNFQNPFNRNGNVRKQDGGIHLRKTHEISPAMKSMIHENGIGTSKQTLQAISIKCVI